MTDFDEDSRIDRATDTKRQFAERFSVSPRTVSTWLSRGLPFLKLSERAIRIPVIEGEAWVRTHFLTHRRPYVKPSEENAAALTKNENTTAIR
jgi:hypothetical protein